MARGYGNRDRYERQYQQALVASSAVAVASTQAVTTENIAAVQVTLNEYDGRLNELENPP